MISEESCDTEAQSNACWKFSFESQEYIFFYIYIYLKTQ